MTQQGICTHAANLSYSTLAKIPDEAPLNRREFYRLNTLGINSDDWLVRPLRIKSRLKWRQFVYFDVNGCLRFTSAPPLDCRRLRPSSQTQ